MKKFGTPSGAGPGSANEKVGFAGVGGATGAGVAGTLARDGRFGVGRFGRVCGLRGWGRFARGRVGGAWFGVGCVGWGGGGVAVVVVVVAGVVVVVVVVAGVVVVVAGVVVVVVDVVVVVVLSVVVIVGPFVPGDELQDFVTDLTGCLTGSGIAEEGVPGATSKVKVSVFPVRSVTVTTHESAEALGSSAVARTARNDPIVASATASLRVLNTFA